MPVAQAVMLRLRQAVRQEAGRRWARPLRRLRRSIHRRLRTPSSRMLRQRSQVCSVSVTRDGLYPDTAPHCILACCDSG